MTGEERICALLRPPHDAAYRLVCAGANVTEVGHRFGANDPDIAEAHGKRVLQDMVVDLSRLYRTNDFARGFFNRISA